MTTNSTVPDDLRPYTEPGRYIDSDHPLVVDFARLEARGLTDPREIAIRLFHAVRDQIRYDPYRIELTSAGMRASRCLETGYGFCITKAALLAAVLRVHGIPTRLSFADVRNHMTSPRLAETMGTDIFAFHGNTDILLDGRWVKATPAFNLSLCEKAGTRPLEFDGVTDSILHPFDLAGRRHMEYVRDRGSFADLPLDTLIEVFDEVYPAASAAWKQPAAQPPSADFEKDVDRVR